MLNVYLAPRSFRAPVPPEAAQTALLTWLSDEEIVGPFADGAYSPGRSASRLFHADALDSFLPAELTFDALRIVRSPKPRFLPERAGKSFPEASCLGCGDTLDSEKVKEALDRLKYVAPERFGVSCPGCRSALTLRTVDFGQNVAVAAYWIFIEGAGLGRLSPSTVERLSRVIGMPLIYIPETTDEEVADWVPARRERRR